MIYAVAAVVLTGAVGGIYFWVLKPANSSAQANENRSTLLLPDDRLAADVRTALGNSSEIKSAIEVSANDGVVTLRGKVTGLYEMQMAESLTKSVLGIKDVKNELQYEKLSPVVDANTGGKTPAQETPARQKPVAEKPSRGPSTADKARSRTLVSQGNTQLDQGEYNAAIASYQQALDLDPDNGQAQSGLSRAQKAKATEDEIMRRR